MAKDVLAGHGRLSGLVPLPWTEASRALDFARWLRVEECCTERHGPSVPPSCSVSFLISQTSGTLPGFAGIVSTRAPSAITSPITKFGGFLETAVPAPEFFGWPV